MLIVLRIFIVALLFSKQSPNKDQFSVSDFRKELSIKLDILSERKIQKGVDLLNQAYVIEREAIDMIEKLAEDEKLNGILPDYKKSVKKMIETSETYREGFMIIYTVFQEKSVQSGEEMRKMRHYAAGLNKARFYEKKATKAFERSLSIRDLIQLLEKPEHIQYKMAEALELDKLAIRDRGRALQIYQDFPVEYDYGWEDDVTAEEVAAAFKDPAISEPPEDLFVQKVYDFDTAAIAVVQNQIEKPILFRVQIAAHTVQIGDEYIREKIYYGKLPVKEIYEGGWYKYSIGEFDNYKEANNLLKSSRVQKAFVVAYQEGKKLTIKDALAKIKENQ